MEYFLHHNGYITVLLTVAFTGEFGLFAGVALAQKGDVTITGVVILGTVASFVGNMFYYYAGRFLWTRWHYLKKTFGPRVESTSKIVQRYGSPVMIVSRFFYGIRNIVPITLGIYSVNVYVFIVYNIIGAFAWAWIFTQGASIFSSQVMKNFVSFHFGLFWGIVSSVVIAALFFIIRKIVLKIQK